MMVKGIAQQDPMGSDRLLMFRSEDSGNLVVVGAIASALVVDSVIAMFTLTVFLRVRRRQ